MSRAGKVPETCLLIVTVFPLARISVYLLLLWAPSAFAQKQASIVGKVTDSKGAAVPGASVRILSGGTNRAESLTDLEGSFKFDGLQEGAYQLTVEIVGLLRASKDVQAASSGSSPNLIIRLEPLPRPPQAKGLPTAPKPQQQ